MSTSGATGDDRQGVKAFDTGLQVLAAFVGAEPMPMLKTIADRAGMHPAKVHRYLVSLCRAGFVAQDEQTGRYRLGEASLRLGFAAESSVDVLREARPLMTQLCQSLRQSVMLGIWSGSGATVALQELVPGPVAIMASIGTVLPLLRSSTGQTFGAWLPRARVREILEREVRELRKAPKGDLPGTMEEADLFLADVRKRGVARVIGQVNIAICGISVPVFDRAANIAAVLTAMGPTGSIDVTWSGSTSKALQQAAGVLTQRIGGVPAV